MNRTDQRVIEIARVIAGIRSVLGLPPDGRACLMQAFAADTESDRAALVQLHEALGRVIEVAADKHRTR
jgi:hypothetical protein